MGEEHDSQSERKIRPLNAGPGEYVTVSRVWHSGDVVEAQFPMSIRTEALPKTPDKQAVFYGPVLLAGALGTDGMTPGMDVNTFQAPYDNQPALDVAAFVAPVGELAGASSPSSVKSR